MRRCLTDTDGCFTHLVLITYVAGWTRYFPIEQFVFVAFEDMANDGDGIQRNIDMITDHIGVRILSVFQFVVETVMGQFDAD